MFVNERVILMTPLIWREHLHAIFAGKLLDRCYHADEGYVTQLLELGQTEAVEEFQQSLNRMMIYG
jgi:hypothetical protein